MNIVEICEKVNAQDVEFIPYLGLPAEGKTLVGHKVFYAFGQLRSVERVYLEDILNEEKKTRKRRKSSDVSQDKRSSQAQSSCFDEGRLSSIDLQARLAESC